MSAETGACKDCNQKLLLAACGAAIVTLMPVALHQVGLLEHLPDPPGGVFESDAITESEMAHPMGIPDGLLGLASYGTTLALAVAAPRCSLLRQALGAKLLLDGGAAAFNATRQVIRFRKLCSWCMGTVTATAVMVYAGRRAVAEIASQRG